MRGSQWLRRVYVGGQLERFNCAGLLVKRVHARNDSVGRRTRRRRRRRAVEKVDGSTGGYPLAGNLLRYSTKNLLNVGGAEDAKDFLHYVAVGGFLKTIFGNNLRHSSLATGIRRYTEKTQLFSIITTACNEGTLFDSFAFFLNITCKRSGTWLETGITTTHKQ